jgi:uncharacterized protein
LTEVNPTRGEDRFLIFDVLRGLSLFGILLVNMGFYTLPMFYYPPGLPHWSRPVDRHLDTLIHSLGETEFLTIFSFLFGLGFAFQLNRIKPSGQASSIFLRRVAVLLAFGLFHAFFIWMGDVLVWYAVAALALFLFQSAKPNSLLIAAATVVALRIVRLEWLVLHSPPGPGIEAQTSAALQRVQHCLQVYAHGSFGEIFALRARDVWFQYTHPVDTLLHILFVFLIGFYLGKLGLFQRETQESRKFFASLWRFGLVFGIGGHVLRFGLPHVHARAALYIDPPLAMLSDFALAAFYVASMVLAMNYAKIAQFLKPFASIGRSTLTNYLCQSLIVTTLVYSYGFGLYGKFTPIGWCALAAAIYILQLSISLLWFRRFAYGPVEWLSRSLIYGKRIPLRLPQGQSLHR